MTECKHKPLVEVVWFKRDLRIVDHRPLAQAAERGAVLPLLIIEPAWWQQPDMSARQFSFYIECAIEFSKDIARLGARLVVRIGDVIDVLEELRGSIEINGLWSHEETGGDWTYRRDMRVLDWCRQRGIAWTELRQDGIIRRLKGRDGWAGKWDKLMAEPVTPAPSNLPPLPGEMSSASLPTAGELGLRHDNPPLRQKGGRTQALSTLHSFVNDHRLKAGGFLLRLKAGLVRHSADWVPETNLVF